MGTIRFAITGLFLMISMVRAQDLTVADIWGPGTPFRMNYVQEVRSMNDGEHFTQLEFSRADGAMINKYSYASYEKVGTIASDKSIGGDFAGKLSIESYEFNADETQLLIANSIEPIYRHSFFAEYFIYDLEKKKLMPLSEKEGRQQLATFSPDGKRVAFVRDNNIFIRNLEDGSETTVTNDGKWNFIINGAADWVYEEEFALTTGMQWSAEGDKLAFYTFDESDVREFEMDMYGSLYPERYRFKYPKAGEKNSEIAIRVFDVNSKVTTTLTMGSETDIYIPRIKWTTDNNKLCILRMNRHQNHLEYLLYNMDPSVRSSAAAIEPELLYEEKSETYIEIDDNLIFLEDGSGFIRTSEKNGFNHIYKIGMDGSSFQITDGKWDVIEFKGVDQQNGLIYYTSAEEGAIYKALYVVNLDGKKKKKLSSRMGDNDADFSAGMKYYINYYSSASIPLTVTLHRSNGKEIKVLEDNESLVNTVSKMGFSEKEFLKIRGAEMDLNAWMIKPPNFDDSKQYPVYFHIYAGPGHNMVADTWGGRDYYWHQLLAQQGYIVISVDPRGTMYRGEAFKKSTYMELGKLETEDMIAVAKQVGSWDYVDADRIGVMGWSYGGYMTSLCMTKGANVFTMGIAVAPVTNWRYYDTIYTERFMRTPQENPDGYDDNSPINHVEKMKGAYLLVHGSADDNVHMQNTMEMINALVNHNKQFDLFIYPNKNHGIYGGYTRWHLYDKMLEFIQENL